MKQLILLLLIFNSIQISAQMSDYYWNDFEHKNYFNLRENIKEVNEFTKTVFYSKSDSTVHSYTSETKQLYNEQGYLLKEYWKQDNDSLFLHKENIYDNNNLISSTEYAREWKNIKNQRVLIDKILSFQEKYAYDAEGKLLTKHQKTSRDSEFYLSLRNTYENGKLKLVERLNNHVETSISGYVMCKGSGYSLNDFMISYKYNRKGLLKRMIKYIDASKRYRDTIVTMRFQDTIIKNIEFSIPIKRKDKNHDFSNFIIEIERLYQYDEQNRMISEKTIDHYKNYYHSEDEVSHEYWGTKKRKTTRKNKNGFIYGSLKEYIVVNKDTLLKKSWHLKGNEENGDLEKQLSYEFVYNSDGSYRKIYYNNYKINEIEFYNTRKDLFEESNSKNKISRKITYEYDYKGNWVKKSITRSENNYEEIERKILYYE